ncbi:hypothetical protein DOTSEDRAFT_24860 [Dothistroma septosporum NZE10]|uniref:F-box domain-containing protein n=1 Tax=Dothistroma septosporum (strain NZE10 / CBS 128990) TaxID=675120 RepID=M2Y3E3_DOTSN|nr:hypothetical protein DOTSEDRAFT_24860 [Dothistroma septosporum NZE10]
MASDELAALPPELLLRITDYLTTQELLPLSASNSNLRECLLPRVFSILRVTNRREDASTALRLAKKHSQYITTLSFEGYASPAENGRATAAHIWGPKGASTLPVTTRALLKGDYLPKLRAARVRFAYDYASDDWSVDPSTGGRTRGFYDFDAAEFDGDIANREPRWKWRALMAETWMALSQNNRIENLEIVDLPPRGTTAFTNTNFHHFLRRLKNVNLSIWGASQGAGWKLETFPGYVAFLSCLHDWLFRHLESTTHLRLSASTDGLPGLVGTLCVGVTLTRTSLQSLNTLDLCRVALDPTLIGFISSHASTLRTLTMDRCIATPSTVFTGIEAKDGVRWADLFKILQHKMFNLTRLEISPRRASLTDDDAAAIEMEHGFDENVHEKLQHEPRLRVFGYGEIREWEDTPSRDHEMNLEAFVRGDDMREYDRLMEVIARNVKAKR